MGLDGVNPTTLLIADSARKREMIATIARGAAVTPNRFSSSAVSIDTFIPPLVRNASLGVLPYWYPARSVPRDGNTSVSLHRVQ